MEAVQDSWIEVLQRSITTVFHYVTEHQSYILKESQVLILLQVSNKKFAVRKKKPYYTDCDTGVYIFMTI